MEIQWTVLGFLTFVALLFVNLGSQGGLYFSIASDQQGELDDYCKRTLNTAHEQCQRLIEHYQQLLEDSKDVCANSLERGRVDDMVYERSFNRSMQVQNEVMQMYCHGWNLVNRTMQLDCVELQKEFDDCAKMLSNCTTEWSKLQESFNRSATALYSMQLTWRLGRGHLQKALQQLNKTNSELKRKSSYCVPLVVLLVVPVTVAVMIVTLTKLCSHRLVAMRQVTFQEVSVQAGDGDLGMHKDHQIQQLTTEIGIRDAKVCELEATMEQKRVEMTKLKSDLQQKEQEGHSLRQELGVSVSRADELRSTVGKLRDSLQYKNDRIHELEHAREEVCAQLQRATKELDETCTKNTSMQEEVTVVKRQLTSAQQQLRMQSEKRKEAETLTSERMGEMTQKLRRRLSELEQSLWHKNQKLLENSLRMRQKDKHIRELNASLMECEKEKVENEQLLIEKQGQNDRLMLELSQIYVLERRNEELGRKLKNSERRISQKNRELFEIRLKAESMKVERNTFERLCEQFYDQCDSLLRLKRDYKQDLKPTAGARPGNAGGGEHVNLTIKRKDLEVHISSLPW